MSYIIVPVTSWKDQRDSSNRIAPPDSGQRLILLNPNRMSDIKVDAGSTVPAPKSIFKYFDNPLNPREGHSTIKANVSVSSLTIAADTAFFSNMITLDICKNNNPANDTIATVIPVASLAYADKYNPDPLDYCWVVYYNAAFKRREVLVNMSIQDLEDLAETGSTSSTTTTTEA